MAPSPFWNWSLLALAALLSLAGLVILLRALFHDRARGRPRCPRCWYDMSAATGLLFPDGGGGDRTPKRLLKTRRRWRLAAVGCLIIIAGAAAGAGEQVIEKGWLKAAP